MNTRMTWVPGSVQPRTAEAHQRRLVGVLTLCVALVYVLGILSTRGARGSLVKGDARSYFAYLPSLIVDRDLDLRNQFTVLAPEGDTPTPFGRTRTGEAANPFPVTPALLWLPGYVVGLLIDLGLGAGGSAAPSIGYGTGALMGAAVWSIVLAGFGAEFTRRLLTGCLGPAHALTATVLAWLATPAIYYTAISPLYSHSAALFAVSLMLWWTWRAGQPDSSVKAWALAGVAAGLVAGVRLQDAALLLVPLGVLAGGAPVGRAARLRNAAAWFAGVVCALVPQIVTWLRLGGDPASIAGSDGLRAPSLANLTGVLFSIGYRGWISWTPIVVPALVGLVLVARSGGSPLGRRFAAFSLLGVAGMYLLDVLHPFGAGAAFGGRRYVSATPVVALGIAASIGAMAGDRPGRRRAMALFAALLLWNGWLLASYELLTLGGIRPTLLQTIRHGVGLGRP